MYLSLLSPQHETVEGEVVVKSKGKHASSTENRRMVWESVVWPLVLEINRFISTLKTRYAGIPVKKTRSNKTR